MEINFPNLPPLPQERKPDPAEMDVTLGQTGNAQVQTQFGSVADQLRFYASGAKFDEDASQAVDDYIAKNNLPAPLANHMRAFGKVSMDDFRRSAKFVEDRQSAQFAMDNSSLGAQIITDPTLPFSVLTPYASVKAMQVMSKSLSALRQAGVTGIKNPVSTAVRARQIMRGDVSRAEITKLAALDAAVSEGVMTFPEALSQAGIDPEQALDDMLSASLYTASSGIIGGALGYGIGSLRPNNSRGRANAFNQSFKEYLNKTAEKPIEAGEDVSLAGKWFTESWLMKAVPTPVRNVLQSNRYDEFLKMEMLALAGDNGIPLVMNQLGKSVGSSVFTNSGRRAGEWFATLEQLDSTYDEIMSAKGRGDVQVLNLELRNAMEKIRGRVGKESYTKQEWYTHIGRLYVDEVPAEKLTDHEARSVAALDKFFTNYRNELEDLGLINSRDLFETRFLEAAGRKGEMISVTNSIIAQNKRWMRPQLDNAAARFEALDAKIAELNKVEQTRGLTDKQIELRKTLEQEMVDAQDSVGRWNDLFDTISSAKNIDDLFEMRNKLDLTPDMRKALGDLQRSVDDLTSQIDDLKRYIDAVDADAPRPRYLPRFFNRRAIASDRQAFKDILVRWYRNNPEIRSIEDGKVVVRKLSTDPVEVDKRAESTIAAIMEETEEEAIEAIFSGFGRGKHFMERTLDIPNSEIKDFIVTDVKELMIAYTNRVAPKIEYHKRFKDPETGQLQTLEQRIDYYRDYMKSRGYSEKEINQYIRDFVHSYDRVVGTTLKRADAIDTKIADGLRTATSWTFLGSSGIAALGDASALFMDHEMESIGRAFLSLLDKNQKVFNLAKREVNLAGEALEITMGTTHLRYMESLSNDMFGKGTFDKLNNAFYIANGLSVVTTTAKVLDGLVRSHTIIDASNKLVKGKATKFEQEFLARYNITPELAQKITEMPVEKTSNGLYLANTEAWTDVAAVDEFRNALRSGIMNRVIMGTPADKPIMMDGVAYIPIRLGRQFGLKEDSRVRGYARLESGLLALPFTFYSYTMGALSKITANYASGSVRNKMAHIAVAMGLGSMIVRVRTPEYIWEDMEMKDKIARSFDFSGLAALYSDLTYRAISMAHETGLTNETFINPKFNAKPDMIGALVSLGGAPADWTYGMAQGIGDMLQGNMSDGGKAVVRHMPLINALAFQGVLKDAAMDVAGSLPNRP